MSVDTKQLLDQGRCVIVFTTSQPDPERRLGHVTAGVEVVSIVGVDHPGGEALVHAIAGLGYQRIDAVTGAHWRVFVRVKSLLRPVTSA